jgi:hypothetical protein
MNQMPKFSVDHPMSDSSAPFVAVDVKGKLWRIDPSRGTARPVDVYFNCEGETPASRRSVATSDPTFAA